LQFPTCKAVSRRTVGRGSSATPTPPGRRGRSRTPTAGCAATCPGISTSMPWATLSSRRSSSATISRPGSASASSPRCRPSSRSLAGTSESASLDPVAAHDGIHQV